MSGGVWEVQFAQSLSHPVSPGEEGHENEVAVGDSDATVTAMVYIRNSHNFLWRADALCDCGKPIYNFFDRF